MRIPLPGLATVAAALVLLPATLALISCGDDRSSGMIVTSDGRMLSNSAENTRVLAQDNIDRDLQRYLSEHWRAKTSILQLPEWIDDHGLDADWRWTQCDATVEIVGDGHAQLPITADDVRDGVRDYLQRRVEQSRHHLTVAVHVAVDAGRFAALAKPPKPDGQATPVIAVAPAPAPATTPEAPAAPTPVATPASAPMQLGAQAYVIQSGDTLAEISAVFYGSTRYWRKILKANPTLDPNSLQVGQQILLPALNEPLVATSGSSAAGTTSLAQAQQVDALHAVVLVLKQRTLDELQSVAQSKNPNRFEGVKFLMDDLKAKSQELQAAERENHWSQDEIDHQVKADGIDAILQQAPVIDEQERIFKQQQATTAPAGEVSDAPAPAQTGQPNAPAATKPASP